MLIILGSANSLRIGKTDLYTKTISFTYVIREKDEEGEVRNIKPII
jgi:hypothetical protein